MSDCVYVPLLKSREGEFVSLGHLSARTSACVTPLIEVVLPFATRDDPPPTAPDVTRVVSKLAQHWGTDERVVVDLGPFAHGLDGAKLCGELVEASRVLRVRTVPAIRLTADDDVVNSTAAATSSLRHGLCVRLTVDDLLEDTPDLVLALRQLMTIVGVRPPAVDLVVDCGTLDATRNVRALARRAHRLLTALTEKTSHWRTLAVAGGAFPRDLSGLEFDVLTELPRRETALWSEFRAHPRLDRLVAFADYGVGWPPVSDRAERGFGAPPQLRYAAARRWLAVRADRRDPRGNDQFHDLCELIVRHPEFAGPGFSWGDRQIGRAAARDGIGPGSATQWRAYATNHHVEHVVDRLTSTGEP
ncbi:beta family protein [Umezawaea beigongshangensis]|uniref:beta family protein n=1 Tax=Umezawaea beigongshangensis TaxID=2780383 RepID=UPI0018F19C78|nr:beta family protein [Umezawaea beigongshangensis]